MLVQSENMVMFYELFGKYADLTNRVGGFTVKNHPKVQWIYHRLMGFPSLIAGIICHMDPYGIWIDTETGWWFQTLIYFPFHIWENPDKIDELHDFSEG